MLSVFIMECLSAQLGGTSCENSYRYVVAFHEIFTVRVKSNQIQGIVEYFFKHAGSKDCQNRLDIAVLRPMEFGPKDCSDMEASNVRVRKAILEQDNWSTEQVVRRSWEAMCLSTNPEVAAKVKTMLQQMWVSAYLAMERAVECIQPGLQLADTGLCLSAAKIKANVKQFVETFLEWVGHVGMGEYPKKSSDDAFHSTRQEEHGFSLSNNVEFVWCARAVGEWDDHRMQYINDKTIGLGLKQMLKNQSIHILNLFLRTGRSFRMVHWGNTKQLRGDLNMEVLKRFNTEVVTKLHMLCRHFHHGMRFVDAELTSVSPEIMGQVSEHWKRNPTLYHVVERDMRKCWTESALNQEIGECAFLNTTNWEIESYGNVTDSFVKRDSPSTVLLENDVARLWRRDYVLKHFDRCMDAGIQIGDTIQAANWSAIGNVVINAEEMSDAWMSEGEERKLHKQEVAARVQSYAGVLQKHLATTLTPKPTGIVAKAKTRPAPKAPPAGLAVGPKASPKGKGKSKAKHGEVATETEVESDDDGRGPPEHQGWFMRDHRKRVHPAPQDRTQVYDSRDVRSLSKAERDRRVKEAKEAKTQK